MIRTWVGRGAAVVLVGVLGAGCAAGPRWEYPPPRYEVRMWVLEIVRGKPKEAGVVASVDPTFPPAVARSLSEFADEWNRCVGGAGESWRPCPIVKILKAREPAMLPGSEGSDKTTFRPENPREGFELDIYVRPPAASEGEATVQLREGGVVTSQVWVSRSGGGGPAIRHDHLFDLAKGGDPKSPGSISWFVELTSLPESAFSGVRRISQ